MSLRIDVVIQVEVRADDPLAATLLFALASDLRRSQASGPQPLSPDDSDELDPEEGPNGAMTVEPDEDEFGNPWDTGEESAGFRKCALGALPPRLRAYVLEQVAPLCSPPPPMDPESVLNSMAAASREVTFWQSGVDIHGATDWRAAGPLWATPADQALLLVVEVRLMDGSTDLENLDRVTVTVLDAAGALEWDTAFVGRRVVQTIPRSVWRFTARPARSFRSSPQGAWPGRRGHRRAP